MKWFFRRPPVYLVYNADNWALYWVGHYVQRYLNQTQGFRAYQTDKPWALKQQTIHFVDRYNYLHGRFADLHPSNRVFLTWYHGDLDDPNPDMQKLFALLPQALPRLSKIITSCTTTQAVLEQVGVPREKIALIPIGIDLPRFCPPSPAERAHIRAELDIPPEAICIGSFQKDGQGWGDGMEAKLVKGPDIFLEVIAQLAKQYPDLLVLLTGPARGYVKAGLEKIGVAYRHHFVEDYHSIARYYHALDLYLITSRSEGGPKAMMEAWATGVPLVSTRMGMPADYLRQGENGMLAEDVAGLVAGAGAFLDDPILRDKCILAGLEAVKPLDWAVIADQYAQLFRA